jgi:hypothetical protein
LATASESDRLSASCESSEPDSPGNVTPRVPRARRED